MRTIWNLNVISITFSSPPHPPRAQTSMSFPRSSLPALSRRIFNRSSQSGETNFAHSYIWSQVGDANLDSRNESNVRSIQWWFWAHGFFSIPWYLSTFFYESICMCTRPPIGKQESWLKLDVYVLLINKRCWSFRVVFPDTSLNFPLKISGILFLFISIFLIIFVVLPWDLL